MRRHLTLIILTLLLLLPSLVYAQDDQTLTIVTYDSFALSEDVIADFEEQSGATLEILRLSDAGSVVNQSILSINNPLGDVLYGVDNTFLGRALENDLFIPYESPNLETVPDEFQVDADEFRVTPVTYGDVCLNYDIAYFEENDLAIPDSLEALTAPEYESLLVVQDPAASSPGLAFLMATVDVFGEEGDYTYLDYWADLVENDVLVVNGWTEAYYGEFTATSDDGERPLVVSYASSPPAEVFFADPVPETAPTGAIVADDTCFRQIEFVGLLQNIPDEKLELAQQFIDFTLSLTFQEDLPLQMFVFPVNENAELPEVFVEYAAIPEEPVRLDFETINTGRDSWIEAWTQTTLR